MMISFSSGRSRNIPLNNLIISKAGCLNKILSFMRVLDIYLQASWIVRTMIGKNIFGVLIIIV
jgi:hypothetical protein